MQFRNLSRWRENLKHYRQNQSGAFLALTAVMISFFLLAISLGLGTFRVQNSATAAEQLVNIACQKIAYVDPAIHPTEAAVKTAIEAEMAQRQVAGADTTDGTISVTPVLTNADLVNPINSDGSQADLRRYTFNVTYQGQVRGLHRQIFKDGKTEIIGSKPCKPICPGLTNVIYSNGAAYGHWIDDLTIKSADDIDDKGKIIGGYSPVDLLSGYDNLFKPNDRLVLTIFSGDSYIRYRRVVTLPIQIYFDNNDKGNNGEPKVKTQNRIEVTDSDQIVIQTLNADGTIPLGCGDSETPPPCVGSACGGSIGGGDVCTDCTEPPGGTDNAFKCEFPEVPVESKAGFTVRPFDPGNSAVFNFTEGQVGSLVMTWSWGKKATVKLAPFYKHNLFPRPIKFRDGSVRVLPGEQISVLYYMSLGNRYLFLMPTKRYPNHRYLIHLSGWQYSWWWDGKEDCFRFKSPIVFDTEGLGRIETSYDEPVPSEREFDFFGTGQKEKIEWPTGRGHAWLVDNRDGRAAVDMNGRRFFGDLDGHDNGYEKLAELDTSGTGLLMGRDLEGLALWFDNGNAIVEEGELKSVQEAGVTAINTQGQWHSHTDGRMTLRSTAIMHGRTIMTEDVYVNIKTKAQRVQPVSDNEPR